MDEQWRLFAAIELPEAVRQRIEREIESLRRLGWQAKWVDPRATHLTVKFYGEVPKTAVPRLRDVLRAGLGDLPAFAVETMGAGVFPHPAQPRVLWLGVGGDLHELAGLQRRVEQLSLGLGFPADTRPFYPHLTLARFRPDEVPSLRELSRQLERLAALPSLCVPVRTVTLFRSELRRTGAVYTVVDSFELETGR
jgi:2'-5' RNA ligase